jgi:lysophospholipase L1-like esterase
MSTDHLPPVHHHEGLVSKTAHEIEHRYQNGENLQSVLHDEIHHLRTAEIKSGHSGRADFKHDLKQLDSKLHADHILPHLHIHSAGRHIGEVDVAGHKADHAGKGPPRAEHPSLQHSAKAGGRTDSHSPPGREYKASALPAEIQSNHPVGNRVAEVPDENTVGKGAADAQSMPQLKQVINRAKAENRPLSLVQIGDSHIAGGLETPALANGLSSRLGVPVNYAEDGIRGAKASDALNNPNFFLKDLNKNTDLVVVSFGSNDSTSRAGKAYRDNYEKLIDQIKLKAPNASVVMVGPTDGAYSGKPNTELVGLNSVTAEQREAAATMPNSSYFDIRAKLGTIADMNGHGWMAKDNLHFTASGYQVIGDTIAQYISDKVGH